MRNKVKILIMYWGPIFGVLYTCILLAFTMFFYLASFGGPFDQTTSLWLQLVKSWFPSRVFHWKVFLKITLLSPQWAIKPKWVLIGRISKFQMCNSKKIYNFSSKKRCGEKVQNLLNLGQNRCGIYWFPQTQIGSFLKF